MLGTLVAIYDVGAFFGAMLCSAFGEKLGRQRSAYIGLGTMIVGTAIQTASFSAAQMLVGRIITGLEEATAVLAAVESKDATETHPNVVARRDDILHVLELEHAQGPVRWGELFENNETKNRRRFFLAIGIQVFQQMSGVNALVYYIPYLLQTSMGLDEKTSLWVSGLNGIVFFLCSAYPIFFLDQFGRPKPFMVVSSVQALSMAMVAILLSLTTTSTNYAAIVFFFTYIAIYGTCYMGTPWLYSPELLPLRLRAKGTAIATSFG
ncbi:hypothetical protein MMC30_003229 [Trapelia coarctata]|nr:hypothetical protein [Trapelia coarctata]